MILLVKVKIQIDKKYYKKKIGNSLNKDKKIQILIKFILISRINAYIYKIITKIN
jgi:hypothetical protein